MNPSILFPQWYSRQWHMVAAIPTNPADFNAPVSEFRAYCLCCGQRWQLSVQETPIIHLKATVFGSTAGQLHIYAGECERCSTIVWSCNDLEALVRACEMEMRSRTERNERYGPQYVQVLGQ